MIITFDIKDVTTLSEEKSVDVRVSGLDARGEEMDLAAHLTKEVKGIVLKFVKGKGDNK